MGYEDAYVLDSTHLIGIRRIHRFIVQKKENKRREAAEQAAKEAKKSQALLAIDLAQDCKLSAMSSLADLSQTQWPVIRVNTLIEVGELGSPDKLNRPLN